MRCAHNLLYPKLILSVNTIIRIMLWYFCSHLITTCLFLSEHIKFGKIIKVEETPYLEQNWD